MTEQEYEIMPHKLLSDLKYDVEALKKKLTQPDAKADELILEIESMKDSLHELTTIFERAIKTAAGTDVTFDVSGMESIANIGEYHEPGMGGNMPAGEVYMPPKGLNGVKGRVVVDGSMKTESGALLINSPVTLKIKDGKVVYLEGKDAHLLEKTFEKFENRAKYPHRVRLVGELGIGINPGAVLIGSMIMDEKVLGTGHIAVGSNYWFGGDIKTIYHGDQVFKNPVYYLDGKKMIL